MSRLDLIAIEFVRCWEFLEPAVARTGGIHDFNTVWDDLKNDKAQLWPSEKSAAVTQIHTHHTGKKICSIWIAGGDLDELLLTEKQITEWAKSLECTAIEIVGRPGWKRALSDYRQTAIVLEKDL